MGGAEGGAGGGAQGPGEGGGGAQGPGEGGGGAGGGAARDQGNIDDKFTDWVLRRLSAFPDAQGGLETLFTQTLIECRDAGMVDQASGNLDQAQVYTTFREKVISKTLDDKEKLLRKIGVMKRQ
jgi:hypothetical protein